GGRTGKILAGRPSRRLIIALFKLLPGRWGRHSCLPRSGGAVSELLTGRPDGHPIARGQDERSTQSEPDRRSADRRAAPGAAAAVRGRLAGGTPGRGPAPDRDLPCPRPGTGTRSPAHGTVADRADAPGGRGPRQQPPPPERRRGSRRGGHPERADERQPPPV